ncbi:hypothetical protein [Streptomyces sp. 8N706]|uniref:hypothetical protein n=1 Tax=Streptomyces sp. 8N706 TaxID=3457416 RepID=UPI003FCFC519
MTTDSRPDAGSAPGPGAGGESDVLVSTGPQGSWAWVGARLEPDSVLAGHGGYADLPEERRRAETVFREQIWLADQWVPGGLQRLEIRYRNDPGTGLVSCALLGQVHAPGRTAAEDAARALRARLMYVPRHVRADGLDADGVRRALTPPRPATGPAGVAEVRKRLAWARSTRHDARFGVGVMVFPLATGPVSWEPVWDALARQEHPTMIGVCLEPCAADEGLRVRLGYLAQEYGRLAVAGTPNPVFQQTVPPDPFAVRAAPLYQDAVHRYAGRVHRLRITLASEGPAPTHLAELVAAAVSAPPDGAVVRVPAGSEAEAAWSTAAALGRTWLEEAYGQGAPAGRLGPVERMLSDLVDLPEATATFRFPYEIPGRPPVFDTAARRGGPSGSRASAAGPSGTSGTPGPRAMADPHFPGL